jgi:hypothetical protein
MVLKVVTGKIFKTLQLQCSLTDCSSVSGQLVESPKREFRLYHELVGVDSGLLGRRCAHVKLSKNTDYLVDNLNDFILSEVMQ